MATKILIGSILKPVDDVRHYHKMAKSLAQKDVEIHIFGFHSENDSELKNIIFHPTKAFKRISFGRIYATIQFLFLGLKLSPEIIICGTHELLKASFQIKILTGAKVIYDVRENYYANIIYTNSFPFLTRYPIAWLVRMNEWFSSIMISHYFLAEKCYETELPFLKKGKYTIIENKLKLGDDRSEKTEGKIKVSSKFIITGTLGELYGTEKGINFFKEFNKIKTESVLNITGICRDSELINKFKAPNIKLLTSSTNPISYTEIINTIKNGGVALLPYQPSESIKDKIPTKFYEYLYYKTPMIIQKNKVWEDFLMPYKVAIFIDFNNFEIEEVIQQIETFDFYKGKVVGEEILWKTEEEKLLNTLNTLH